jgi:hypothetical protein
MCECCMKRDFSVSDSVNGPWSAIELRRIGTLNGMKWYEPMNCWHHRMYIKRKGINEASSTT